MQGELLKWFTTDFEGEGGEELDFLAGLQDNWTVATIHGMEFIERYRRLKDNHQIVLTAKWWTHLRYNHFGSELKRVMEAEPALLATMRELFRSQNDKLSYFDFFQYVQHKLKIGLENWEEDALEGRLDRLGMAFIEFNEFNEFSLDYGLSWGEPLLENDLEDILDAKINLSYKDYVVTEKDYFEGCPTMFTNEKAALNRARAIYKELKAKKSDKYIDETFGPSSKDPKRHAESLYWNGVIPDSLKGLTTPEEIEWVGAEELCDPGEFPQFLDDSAGCDDPT
jgi:hypothetical protein